MTAPTPREQVAEVLAEHTNLEILSDRSGALCSCDKVITSSKRYAAHLVDALAAAGLLPDREEWGYRQAGHVTPTQPQRGMSAEDVARFVTGTPPVEAVHRYLTEWRTA